MKLTTALNSFLNHFYNFTDFSANPERSISAQAFYESVIVRAVQSPEFRRRLVEAPATVLAELGVQLPAGVKVTFVENTDRVVHIAIPPYVGE